MTRDDLTNIMNEIKSLNQSDDFVFSIEQKEMRSVLTRLRHMKSKGLLTDFWKVNENSIEVLGYIGYN
jgi:hypothetical protein